MKPFYSALKSKHYSSAKSKPSYVGTDELYAEIGYASDQLLKQDPNYENTCAVRMSLALIKVGVPIHGRLKIKAGPFAGRSVEPGAKLLADQLSRPNLFGKPLLIDPADMPGKIKPQGVILFWKIFGYGGGHIDLIEPSTSNFVCHSACHPICKQIWFWPLHN